MRVAPDVKLFLQFGTVDVRDYCIARGYLAAFEQVGAEILQPACGACANCGPGTSTDASQVTISAINRNFPGRGERNPWADRVVCRIAGFGSRIAFLYNPAFIGASWLKRLKSTFAISSNWPQ